jgi:hypothetical protein
MKDQSKRNPVGVVVVYKKDGFIMEFKRDAKKKIQVYAHSKPAINAVKKLRVGDQLDGEWVAMTTIRLAEIHRKEWEMANQG